MTANNLPGTDIEDRTAITASIRDYYEGWFEGDADRMRRAVHPELVKRRIADDRRDVVTVTATDMIEATADGAGTRHSPDSRHIDISINHVHGTIADVHVTGDVYVDYLQLVKIDGRWQILNALWASAQSSGRDVSSSRST